MKQMRKLFRIKRGFTLTECILAIAILAATVTILLPALSGSMAFIRTSQSLDELTSLAEQKALTYPYGTPSTEFVAGETEGFSSAYSYGFKAQIYFEVQTEGVNSVDFKPRVYKMVATIAKDERKNIVVYYDIDPSELKEIYAREYFDNE